MFMQCLQSLQVVGRLVLLSGSAICNLTRSRSIIVIATAAMAGGTQLFEGAHLTGGNTRFSCESSKCRNYALFVGQSIKYAL